MRSSDAKFGWVLIGLLWGCGSSATFPGAAADQGDDLGVAEPVFDAGLLQDDGPCGSFSRAAAEVWNTRIRGNLDFSLKIYQREINAADAEWLVTRMDRFSLAWARLSESSCRQHHEEGALSSEEYERRSGCLGEALEQQRGVVANLAAIGSEAGGDMDALFEKLTGCVPQDSGYGPEIKSNPFEKKRREKQR